MDFFKDKLKGCLVGGLIGDAIGGRYEGSKSTVFVDWSLPWIISDDTQLTLATCEAIYNVDYISAAPIAGKFLEWFNQRRLTGLGASTLKALRELQVGGHWALVGRSGEYAAGNGAAMRIAPLAFKKNISRQLIQDICSITHKNDEAYTGALAVFYCIQKLALLSKKNHINFIESIVDELPGTLVKDRLIELNELQHLSITEAGKRFKNTGYVVDTVPMAIFCAQKIYEQSIKDIFNELICLGGDTDTICSITYRVDTILHICICKEALQI